MLISSTLNSQLQASVRTMLRFSHPTTSLGHVPLLPNSHFILCPLSNPLLVLMASFSIALQTLEQLGETWPCAIYPPTCKLIQSVFPPITLHFILVPKASPYIQMHWIPSSLNIHSKSFHPPWNAFFTWLPGSPCSDFLPSSLDYSSVSFAGISSLWPLWL